MAIAVVHQDQVVYTKGFGVKKLGGADPIDPHTLFPIGSTSKAFTSALVALLADGEKLRWGDRVSDHVPRFRDVRPLGHPRLLVTGCMATSSSRPLAIASP